MILGRIILVTHGETYSLIRKKWLTKIFVIGDVLSFVAQAAGKISLDIRSKRTYSLLCRCCHHGQRKHQLLRQNRRKDHHRRPLHPNPLFRRFHLHLPHVPHRINKSPTPTYLKAKSPGVNTSGLCTLRADLSWCDRYSASLSIFKEWTAIWFRRRFSSTFLTRR